MNMNTALQNLYKAVSGEDNHKRNISKLLCDIHYAITGQQSSVKNNYSRIIDSMATNWPSGGGGGSSDFSTANVTFICNGGEGYNFFIVSGYYIFNGEAIIPTSEVPIQVDYDVNVTVGIPLYKGESIRLPFLCFENTGENFPVCTGDIVLDTGGSFVISGDGTITIQGGELM